MLTLLHDKPYWQHCVKSRHVIYIPIPTAVCTRSVEWCDITFVPFPRLCRKAWTMRRGPMALMSKWILRPSAFRSPNSS